MNDIRQKIIAQITEQKITQKELAARSGISYISLNRFLTGNRQGIGMETLLCIAKGLNTPAEYLLLNGSGTIDDELKTLLSEINRLPITEKEKLISVIKSIIKIYHNSP